MLKLDNIKTYYGNIQALKGISLEVNEGEIITLIGANGAGKSTTLMSICGIVSPREGDVILNDENITKMSPDKIVTKGVIQVPEGRRIFPFLTVQENLDMGAFLRKDKAQVKRDNEYMFELFPRLAERRSQQGGTLSGGEQQMLAISRALMGDPKILLLDEPSCGLTSGECDSMIEVINSLPSHITTIVVAHDMDLIFGVADRIIVLYYGTLLADGSPEEIQANPRVKEIYMGVEEGTRAER